MFDRKWGLGLLALAAVLILWTLRPDRRPAEERIAEVIDACVVATREGEISDFMEHISPDFRGRVGSGDSDRKELKSYLLMMILRGGSVDPRIVSQDIHVRDDEQSALAILNIVFTKGGLGGALEGKLSARRVELDFLLEDSDWKVVSSRHREADLSDAL